MSNASKTINFLKIKLFDRSFVYDNDLKIISGALYPVADNSGLTVGHATVYRDWDTEVYYANLSISEKIVKSAREDRLVVNYTIIQKPSDSGYGGLQNHFGAIVLCQPQSHLKGLPILIAYIEDIGYKCSCGARHTSFKNIHSRWCDAYID